MIFVKPDPQLAQNGRYTFAYLAQLVKQIPCLEGLRQSKLYGILGRGGYICVKGDSWSTGPKFDKIREDFESLDRGHFRSFLWTILHHNDLPDRL